jgi:hypothetical protein
VKAAPQPIPEPKSDFSKSVSDSSLKFTHVLYNLSPAGKNLFHDQINPLHS